jgi:hypothetical protein
VIEAAYRLDGDEASWLMGVARTAEPILGRGLGVLAWTFARTPAGEVVLPTRIGTGSPEFVGDIATGYTAVDERDVGRVHAAGPCHSISETLGAEWMIATPFRAGCCERYAFRDLLDIVAGDPTGHGVGIGVPIPEPTRTSRTLRKRWGRLGAHLAAGYRARRALAAAGVHGATAMLDTAEAVLTPAGKVAHASDAARGAEAREALRRAARAVDRARSRLRFREADAAIDLWQGLFHGRWSLMDVFDSDGRRFVVARRNDPEVPPRGGLSTREFQVLAYRAQAHPLKLIAYECG